MVIPGFTARRSDDINAGRPQVLHSDQCEGPGIRSLLSGISAQLVRSFILVVLSSEVLTKINKKRMHPRRNLHRCLDAHVDINISQELPINICIQPCTSVLKSYLQYRYYDHHQSEVFETKRQLITSMLEIF